jgi:hypothetical protein
MDMPSALTALVEYAMIFESVYLVVNNEAFAECAPDLFSSNLLSTISKSVSEGMQCIAH